MDTVILRSDKPNAKVFRRWITSEALPSIRKHGAYVTDDQLDNFFRDPELAFELLSKLQSERGKTAALEAHVEKLTPKARYCDIILQCKNAAGSTTATSALNSVRTVIWFPLMSALTHILSGLTHIRWR